MCGVAGTFSDQPGSQYIGVVRSMTSQLSHRGPDNQDVYVSSNGDATLGMATLSVVKPGGGYGPLVDLETGVSVTYNGEIYGFRRYANEWSLHLRPDDTDLDFILKAYLQKGINFIDRIDGMYVIVIHDPRERTSFIVRDRVGQKSVYLHQDGGTLFFASELRALPLGPNVTTHLPDSVFAIETFRSAQTPYPAVKRLRPGTCLRLDHATGRQTEWTYWSIEEVAQPKTLEAQANNYWVKAYADALHRSVEEQRSDPQPHALLLSGGLDSAVLAYLMKPSLCVTVRYPGELVNDESSRAQLIADDIGSELLVVEPTAGDFKDNISDIVNGLDYPVGNASQLPEYMAYKALSNIGYRVVSAGIGPDEHILGYVRHLMALYGPEDVLASGHTEYQPLANRLSDLENESVEDRYLALTRRGPHDPPLRRWISDIFNTYGLRTDQAISVVDHYLSMPALLTTSDKLAGWFSLERRSPYLSQELIEISMQAPFSLRGGSLHQPKFLLREAAKHLGVPARESSTSKL